MTSYGSASTVPAAMASRQRTRRSGLRAVTITIETQGAPGAGQYQDALSRRRAAGAYARRA
jgi:hypothetical protein